MIEIDDDKTIYLNRGDRATIELSANNKTYTFKPNDIIKLRIYSKNGYNKKPMLEKAYKVDEETNQVRLELDEKDTEFCPQINKPSIFWYDISLNETSTIIGFNEEEGAKKFVILPAKKGDDDGE